MAVEQHRHLLAEKDKNDVGRGNWIDDGLIRIDDTAEAAVGLGQMSHGIDKFVFG
jgi:hypothetical protein